jgi:chemotaxis protein CheD
LLSGLRRKGAQRERMEAKLFGGARMMSGLSDIGARNADFAKRYLASEGIRMVGGDTGGRQGRRIQFAPVSGHAMRSYIANFVEPAPPRARASDVDLF